MKQFIRLRVVCKHRGFHLIHLSFIIDCPSVYNEPQILNIYFERNNLKGWVYTHWWLQFCEHFIL